MLPDSFLVPSSCVSERLVSVVRACSTLDVKKLSEKYVAFALPLMLYSASAIGYGCTRHRVGCIFCKAALIAHAMFLAVGLSGPR